MNSVFKRVFCCPKYILCIICGLSLALLLVLASLGTAFLCANEVTVDLEPKVLCETRSVVGSRANFFVARVDIPPNVAITKIYCSIKQNPEVPLYFGQIEISSPPSGLIFWHRFSKDPAASVGEFETTLLQPLRIGEGGATLSLLPFDRDVNVEADFMIITVVYCPDI